MVMISLGRHQANPIESFESAVRGIPEARACFHLTGRYDYLVHVVVRDIEHLRELVTKRLASIHGVEKEETFIVLSAPKEDTGYPITLIPPDGSEQIHQAVRSKPRRKRSPRTEEG
jgi:DNA-binding Lrp family transcriptional regulator